MGFTASRAVGPALAGLVIDLWGAETAFFLNALSFVVFLLALALVRTRPVPLATTENWMRRFRDGVHYVFDRPPLRLVVFTAFVAAFFGQSMVQLAAGIADEVFDVGGDGLGLLVAVYGTGSTVASVALVVGADRLRRSRTASIGIGLFAVGLGVTVSSTFFLVGLAGFLVAGTAHGFTSISLNTAIQAQVHEEYRGRALSMFLMALLAGMPLGTLVGGVLGDLVGLRAALACFGTAMLAYLLFATVRLERLRLLDGADPIEV
jgi:predicted MFS family arabinose efflux permease